MSVSARVGVGSRPYWTCVFEAPGWTGGEKVGGEMNVSGKAAVRIRRFGDVCVGFKGGENWFFAMFVSFPMDGK